MLVWNISAEYGWIRFQIPTLMDSKRVVYRETSLLQDTHLHNGIMDVNHKPHHWCYYHIEFVLRCNAVVFKFVCAKLQVLINFVIWNQLTIRLGEILDGAGASLPCSASVWLTVRNLFCPVLASPEGLASRGRCCSHHQWSPTPLIRPEISRQIAVRGCHWFLIVTFPFSTCSLLHSIFNSRKSC